MIVEKEGLARKQLDVEAMDRLKRYRWPGNVRELENLVRRLAALYPQDTITGAIIDAELDAQPMPLPMPASRAERAPNRKASRMLSNGTWPSISPASGTRFRLRASITGSCARSKVR